MEQVGREERGQKARGPEVCDQKACDQKARGQKARVKIWMRPAYGPAWGAAVLLLAAATARAQSTVALPPDPERCSIQGTVEDASSDVLQGASITVRAADGSAQTVVSDSNGEFRLTDLAPGAFDLEAEAPTFAPVHVTGVLRPGEQKETAAVVLSIATTNAAVTVTVTRAELGAEEVHAEEQQKVFGAIPNFLVTYDWHAVPLTPKQKWALAFKSVVDPVSIAIVAGTAGVQQWDNALSGYGQGAQGYGKRFGADYANLFFGTMLGSGALPIVFRQDPRYFYKGSGTVKSRVLYAIATPVIARSDAGKWEPNYSNILGSFAAGGITNLYYPKTDRDSAGVVIEDGLVGIATGAIDSLFQEFLVRRLTPHLPPASSAKP